MSFFGNKDGGGSSGSEGNIDLSNIENLISNLRTEVTTHLNEYPNDLANIENLISDLRTDVNVHLNEYPTDLSNIENLISNLRTDVTSHLNEYPNDLANIENLISNLRTEVTLHLNEYPTDLLNIENLISNLRTEVDVHLNEYPNDLSNIENLISELRTDVTTHLNEYPNDLANIEGSISNLRTDVNVHLNEYPNDLSNIEGSISELRTDVNVHLGNYPNDLAKKMNTTILYEGDMNTLTTEGHYYVHGTATNRPMDGASFYISVFRYNDAYIKQIAYRATGTPDVASEVYMRQLVSGVWQTWVKLINQKDLASYQQIATATAASQNITNNVNTDLIFTSVTGADWASINNGKVRLQAGKYDLLMVTAFAFGTGARAITPHLSTHTVSQNAVSLTNTMTRIQGSAKFTLTATTDLFLPAFQNSGAELPVSATVQITRIGDA